MGFRGLSVAVAGFDWCGGVFLQVFQTETRAFTTLREGHLVTGHGSGWILGAPLAASEGRSQLADRVGIAHFHGAHQCLLCKRRIFAGTVGC